MIFLFYALVEFCEWDGYFYFGKCEDGFSASDDFTEKIAALSAVDGEVGSV